MTTRPPHPHEALSDRDLLDGWRRGDRSMGSTLFGRHAAGITAFFRRNVYDRTEVEDLTQDTFLALRESRTDIENVSAFLYRIAFFKFTRYLRKRRGLPELVDQDDDLEQVAGDLVPDPEYFRGQREETRVLLRAIRRLALIHQQVLELHFWEGKAGSEIAAILGVPEGTVRSRLKHAAKNLDDKVRELAGTDAAFRSTTVSLENWRKQVQDEIARGPLADEPARPKRKK